MKKFTSLLLALVMILALAIPAFADDDTPGTDGTAKTTYKTEAKGFEMKVTLTGNTNVKAVFNPYGIKVTDSAMKVEEETSQVISAPVFITSKTEVPLIIDAKVGAIPSPGDSTATPAVPASGITAIVQKPVVADPADNTKNLKDVFLYFEIAKAGDASEAPTWKKLDDATKALFNAYDAVKADAASTDATKKAAYDAAAKALTDLGLCPVSAINKSKTFDTDTAIVKFEKVCVMAAGNEEPSYAAFHLAGNALAAPYVKNGTKYEPGTWSKDDTFDATVVLSFRPDVSNS